MVTEKRSVLGRPVKSNLAQNPEAQSLHWLLCRLMSLWFTHYLGQLLFMTRFWVLTTHLRFRSIPYPISYVWTHSSLIQFGWAHSYILTHLYIVRCGPTVTQFLQYMEWWKQSPMVRYIPSLFADGPCPNQSWSRMAKNDLAQLQLITCKTAQTCWN